MNSQTVEITSAGIRKILNKYTPERAIAEYVWNGFDAKATVVNIDFEIDNAELDTIKNIRITDNGTGICYEELPIKFKKFYESQKRIANENNTEFTRGKNGYGRFTFYKFARFANWETRYSKDAQIMSYDIRIDSDTLKDYTTTEPLVSDDTTTGTCVVFNEISSDISSLFITKTLIPYLKAEFAWFLELKSEYQIYINGQELDYSSIIAEQESISPILSHNQKNNINFQCKYIRWNVKMNDEYSRFYFLNNDLELKFTKTTLLNKKGDNFWHSVIVIDDFFNEINCDNELDDNAIQPKLFDNSADRKLFKELITQLNEFLKKKRRPFLKEQAEVMVTKYKNEDVFPKFGTEDWDIVRREGLENFVKELYEVEPAVFMKLNKEQKRVFLELLNLVMDSGERDSLFMAILKKEGEWEAGSSAKENRKDKKKDKKVAKGKGPEIPDGWLKADTEWMPAESNETVYAIPGRWKDIYDQAEKNLKVLHAGVKLGTDKGKGLIPDQALALSTMLNKDHFPQVELSYEDAIRYLRKEAVNLPTDTPKGYVLVTYRQVPIGWEKNIGNRANNLYPQEWKIKSSHGTGEQFTVNSL